ncbi:helix-turn-helix transcriptional regulator [Microbacterium aurantiacum]|uniref:helix-turn-helix transcriptional regulator n=1 Tax=Microbacterium aurantiacum TaxID=162393 RepID=UPI00341B5059
MMGTRALVDVVFGGVLTDGRLVISDAFGARTKSVLGQRVSPGEGAGGQSMMRGRPVSVADYFASDEITHKFDSVVRLEGLRSMAAVPVIIDDAPRSVLYAATRDRHALGSAVLGEIESIAASIGREIRLRDEVDRRVALLRFAEGPHVVGDRVIRESVRQAYAELLSIASTTADRETADRILAVAGLFEARPSASRDTPRLSRREFDVLSQVALGCEYAEVARRLSLQPVTVKSYMRSVMAKLGVHSRTEAVAAARRAGILL